MLMNCRAYRVGLAQSERDQQDLLPKVYIVEAGVVKVDSLVIRLEGLKTGLQELLCSIEKSVRELKLGLEVVISPGQVEDQLWNRSPNYMMRYRMTGTDISSDMVLLAHILKSAKLREKYFEADGETLRQSKTSAWMLKYDDLQARIFLLVHLVSGMPGRATELVSYRRKNGADGLSLRSVYYQEERVFFVPWHNKSNNSAGKQRSLARFLDKRTSLILLEDLFFLRPVAAVFSKSEAYLNDFFVFAGNVATPPELCDLFREQFNAWFGVALLFSSWRQVAATMAWDCGLVTTDDLRDDEVVEMDDSDGDLVARQTGHTRKTALAHYGNTNKVD